MIALEALKRITLENFFINEQKIREKFPEEDNESIANAMELILTNPTIFRQLDNNNYTIYSRKEYRNIIRLLDAKKRGAHIEISGKKKDGTEYFRKGTVDGFVFTSKEKALVRIQDELRSRYSNFFISENKLDNVKIVPPKKFQK
jgi:hypothetical protein